MVQVHRGSTGTSRRKEGKPWQRVVLEGTGQAGKQVKQDEN
jgi:hypothetical protein